MGLIQEDDYAFDVSQAMEYLKGNNQHVFDEFLNSKKFLFSEHKLSLISRGPLIWHTSRRNFSRKTSKKQTKPRKWDLQ